MYSVTDDTALPVPGFPIRRSAGQRLFSASPRLIAAVHVLHRLLLPRHPPYALILLTVSSTYMHLHWCVPPRWWNVETCITPLRDRKRSWTDMTHGFDTQSNTPGKKGVRFRWTAGSSDDGPSIWHWCSFQAPSRRRAGGLPVTRGLSKLSSVRST